MRGDLRLLLEYSRFSGDEANLVLHLLPVNSGSNIIFELLNQVDQLAKTTGCIVVACVLADRIADRVVPENIVLLETN